MFGMLSLMLLIVPLLMLAVFWVILKKAGYPRIWALVALVPLANIIGLLWFALSDWPVHRELREVRGRSSVAPTG